MASDPAVEPSEQVVLIVDDDRDIRQTLAHALHLDGKRCHLAANGAEALALLRAHHAEVCLVLLDLMMPVMSGQEFLAALRADPALRRIPVVILSGDGRTARWETELQVPYLLKPVELETLYEVVRRYCGGGPAPGAASEPSDRAG